ncbi:hypothetical protein JCM6882_005547 [Rhodosporidiobolus microsporus]
MHSNRLLCATAALVVPLCLAAPLRLSTSSISRCEYLLSESDLQPFLEQWRSPKRAAEDVLGELTGKLRFERRKRDLLDEVCDTLVDSDSTTNVLSNNEIAGVEYSGAGLLEGLDINLNPSILSGIFQTATASPTAATTVTLTMSASATATPHRSSFRDRKSALSASASSAAAAEARAVNKPLISIAIEGQGLLDGVDLTVAPALLNSLLQPRTVAATAAPAERTGPP